MLVAQPAEAHFLGSISHIWAHIKPKADARYDMPAVKKLETVRGTVGGQVITSATGEWGFNAQLPRAARKGLDDAHVTIDGTPDEASGECPGTAANPTAKPGYVCIYEYSSNGMSANAGYIWGSGDGTNWGFQASVDATTTGEVWWFANWAYKGTNAPLAPRSTFRATSNGCITHGQGGC